ncbi:alkaline phosphatase family protein [Terriglobus roseus]|uniref:Predicted pyrophosphatase or phosphodiesterase, AlkP superfamily n=1 Tax=Terriglobus roseus TaxID=392734 RepID=A0A1H4K7P2_9BACT|nr:ectonucleotide pyrophosphatase/phosphodiesterase [Terriglobus roseus]SEB54541.1 Predicted pyrophosphatase or phosphodiesterase, AlkP superfamily [Terriglobus roseus]
MISYKNLLAAALLLPLTLHAAPRRHVLVMSIDGMGAQYLTQADKYGLKIPTLRQFKREGVYADGVIGVLPTMTYPSHTTMMTGVTPAEHGVYANQKFDPLGTLHGEAITEADTIKVKTLWQAAHDAGYTTASVGFPVTTDATGIDWLMPANGIFEGRSEDGAAAAKADPNRHYDHPAGLRETLAPDVAEMHASDLEQTRVAWTIAILRHYKPNLMTTHLGDLDHAEHTTGPFSQESLAALEYLDGRIALLIAEEKKIDPDAVIVIVSDHGFEPVEKTFNPGVLLTEAGLLQPAAAGAPGDWKASFWNTGGTAAIVLKDPTDKAVLTTVDALLQKAAANPEYGIASVLRKADIEKTGGFPTASFVIEMKLSFKIGNGRKGAVVTDTPHTGTHGYLPQRPELYASFLMMGPGVVKGKDVGLIDMRQVATTLADLLGVKLSSGAKAKAVAYAK